MILSPEIQNLIQSFSRLPGLGPRSAQRIALHLLKNKQQILIPLLEHLKSVQKNIQECSICFNWDTISPCGICTHPKRDPHTICVVENVADLWALERSGTFQGLYHVLGGTLSAIDGMTPEKLNIFSLQRRLKDPLIQEVVLAFNTTMEGQTTFYYLMEQLKNLKITISTLAQGVPLGGELDYLDERTINLAFQSRQTLNASSSDDYGENNRTRSHNHAVTGGVF